MEKSPEKNITIYDLADKLNLSAATVSRGLQNHPAINKDTKKKIYDLAEAMGYRSNNFAKNLSQQKSHTIGVIVPRLNSNFTSTAIAGMENVANKAGYNLIISQSVESYNKEVANAKTMFNNGVDGLLVSLAYDTNNIEHFEPFFKKNLPLIFFDRVGEHKDCTNIIIDNRKASYDATIHLLDQGCKRIVHISAPSARNVYVERLTGYKDALLERKIEFKEDYIILGDLSHEAGVNAAETILKITPGVDGVFAANDSAAVGCMIALKKAGIKIPGDVAFVGFNNDPISQVIEPNLTTINYHGFEMGETAAQNLINHLEGLSSIKSTNRIVLRSELIIRASSLRQE